MSTLPGARPFQSLVPLGLRGPSSPHGKPFHIRQLMTSQAPLSGAGGAGSGAAAAAAASSGGSAGAAGAGAAGVRAGANKSFFSRLGQFVSDQFLPLALITAMTVGTLFPEPGLAAAQAGYAKLATVGIFFLSGVTLKVRFMP